MRCSHLSNPSSRVVADTSVIININGTQCGADILRALPDRMLIVDIAAAELDDGRKNGRKDADLLTQLYDAQLVEFVSLGDAGAALFEQLVAGPAHATLDDGEAATIAYAVEHSLGIIVDDSKARRVCRERYNGVKLRCSVDLFKHPSVYNALGDERLSVAVLNALMNSRMRVIPEDVEWIVQLIGEEHAKSCRSLPKGR